MADVAANPPPLLDPPQWAERRQLIRHLLHNADGLVYLRGPTGAGKTRFLVSLLEHLSEEFQVVKLDHPASVETLDGFARSAAALAPARTGRAGPPLTALEKPALLLLDNADGLNSDALLGLKKIADNRGRAVLLGRGGPAVLAGSRSIRWVDLPPFTEDQTRTFATSLDAGVLNRLGPERLRTLYLETGGLPGNIIARISVSGAGARAGVARRPLMWLGAGLIVVLAAGAIWEQDRINAWFAEDAAESLPPLAPSPTAQQPAPSDKVPAPPLLEPPSLVDAPTPALGAPQSEPPLLKPAPVRRKPPQIDLPSADILREIVREPWHAEAPLLATDEPSSPEPAADSLPSGPAVTSSTEPPHELATSAVTSSTEPPQDLATPAVTSSTEPPHELATSAVTSSTEPPQDLATSADTLSTVPPNDLATPADDTLSTAPSNDSAAPAALARPDGVLAEPANAKAALAQTPERAMVAPQPPAKPSSGGFVALPKTASGLPGNAWLRELPPTSYTLQLVGARDLGALQRFVKRHALQGELAVFERKLEGRPWFALLLGSFPDRQAALAARAQLPGRLAKEAWPRRLQDIHKLMKNQG